MIHLLETEDRQHTKIAHVFMSSLRPVPLRRIAEALPYFSSDLEVKRFANVRSDPDGTKQIIDLHILDGISSVNDFTSMFSSRLDFACKSDVNKLVQYHSK